MRRSRQSHFGEAFAFVSVVGMMLSLTGGAWADLLVYEPFDYTVGDLADSAGGIGMTNSWADGPEAPGKAYVYNETTATTPVNTGAGVLSWDGVVNNLPTLPALGARYVGLSATAVDKWEAYRPLAQSAGSLAGGDNVLWVSAVSHFKGGGYGAHFGLALGTDCFNGRSTALSTTGSYGSGDGNGIGVGGAFNNSYVTPVVYNGGSIADRTTTGAAALSTSLDNIVILKFVFGSNDTVSAWSFSEDDPLDEATFNSNAVSATAVVDESKLNIITYSGVRGQHAIDEIRVGDTFTDVISAPPAAGVDPDVSIVSASPTDVLSDGVSASTITVALMDHIGNPVEGKDVTLAATAGPGTPVIAPSTNTTDASGVATFTVTSVTVGTNEFTATDVTDGIGITQKASVWFSANLTDADLSTVKAWPATTTVGSSNATVTVTLQNSAGLLLAGKVVSLANTAGPGTPVIDPATDTTDASGQASFVVSSSTVGSETFEAACDTDSVTLTQTVDVAFVTPDPPALLVYEGFDYPPGDNIDTPLEGGIGFGDAWIRAQEGANDTITVATGAPGSGNLDGAFTNPDVETSPAGSENCYVDGAVGDDRLTANRLLSSSAGALAGGDKVLWASILWTMNGGNYGRQVGFILGTDGLRSRSQNVSTSTTWGGSGDGDAIGVGGAINTTAVTPTVWNGGNVVARTTAGAKTLSTSHDNIVILKFVFADGSDVDTVYAWAFAENETITEAEFNANAIYAQAAVDQNVLNIVSFGQSQVSVETVDEIRIGSTFHDVLSLPPPPTSGTTLFVR